jgi:hypothetical protein
MKMGDIRASRLKRAWVVRPGLGPMPPGLVWPSWPTSLTYCALEGSRDKILTPKKSHVNLSSGRFLKCQNTQNRVFLFYRVITKIRGIDGKSP